MSLKDAITTAATASSAKNTEKSNGPTTAASPVSATHTKKPDDTYANVKRIAEVWDPFDCWNVVVTPEAARKAYESKKLNDQPFDPVKSRWSADDHAQRIAWFMNIDSSKWDPIIVESGLPSYDVDFEVMDGNHRLAAAILLKLDRVRASLSGCVFEIEHFMK